MKNKEQEFKCNFCGRNFASQQALNSHVGQTHDNKVKKTCLICGQDFAVIPSQADERKTCGREKCSRKYRSKITKGSNNPNYKGSKTEICKNCGEEFKGEPAYIEKREYCSRECAFQDREAKTKITKICKQCGKEFETWEAQDKIFCSTHCNGKYYGQKTVSQMIGENNPNWKGGYRSRESSQACGPNWNRQRMRALKRDNFKCQFCNMDRKGHRKEYNSDLEVHHIIPRREYQKEGKLDWEQSNKIGNLITLCKACHRSLEVINGYANT